MSDTGKQSPLGVNVLSSLLQNIGLHINAPTAGYIGDSQLPADYTLGTICNNTCLRLLTYSINAAYSRGVTSISTYNNLITIGSSTIPAFGNSKAATFDWTEDPGWNPYELTDFDPVVDPIGQVTSWGFIRLFALQAYDDFNWNDTLRLEGAYRDFLTSFNTSYSFIEYTNSAINAVYNSSTFLEGTYSNMNDLITADISGVSLATTAFGQDLINLGKAIDLSTMYTFGLPSHLLKTMQQYNAITPSVSLALLASEIPPDELNSILANNSKGTVTPLQQRNIYGAFSIIVGVDLDAVLISLNCTTVGLESLVDLLNPKKLFPNSYTTLTVPIYTTIPGPTNSKTYYPIYDNEGVSSRLTSPAIEAQIGTIVSPTEPIIVTEVPIISATVYESVSNGDNGDRGDSDGGAAAGDGGDGGDGGGDGGGGGL